MKLFGKKNREKETSFVVLHLNARLQPMHRGEIFEDLLENVFSTYEIGEVLGGGTVQKPSGEIESCDIEMNIRKENIDSFIPFLRKIDIIPKGSTLAIDSESIEIGCAEGLALYLNGTDLPAEVYQNNDVNVLIGLLDQALEGIAQRLSYWEGRSETALYYYGKNYAEMKERITEITKKHPLCEKSRFEQIA